MAVMKKAQGAIQGLVELVACELAIREIALRICECSGDAVLFGTKLVSSDILPTPF